MDEVLFNLQSPWAYPLLTDWQKDFVQSISQQYVNWKASTTRMPFGSPRQREALLGIHKKLYPVLDINTFTPFEGTLNVNV